MSDLFDEIKPVYQPLAARMRPRCLAEYVGQSHLLAQGKPLRQAIEQGALHSMILWGPPGVGKTTLAKIIAHTCDAHFMSLSAVLSGVKEIRAAVEEAKHMTLSRQCKVILFVDEVHRFNKSQQDAFLPHIEDGTIIFIGATTENPAFELNQAILSRARVYTLKKLSAENLNNVLQRAISYQQQSTKFEIIIDDETKKQLIALANGDARRLLNLLENCLEIADVENDQQILNKEQLIQVAGNKIALYDKGGDAFYDLISAFHKSVRGSDPDAALYWYARILTGGGDALYVARRLLAIASEDIGNADPRAMQLAINAWDTFQRVGPSEGERAIAQATVYMALAPKSNAVYMAFSQAKALAKETSELDVPLHLKNSTSAITKELGHGSEYRYAHNEVGGFAAGENYFPQELAHTTLYQPTDRGLEKQLRDKLNYLNQLNQQSDQRRYD